MKNEYNIAARAGLFALALTAAFALNTTAIAQAPPGSLWYNGDWNHVNFLSNERNTLVSQAAVYDDFNVTSPLWNVTASSPIMRRTPLSPVQIGKSALASPKETPEP